MENDQASGSTWLMPFAYFDLDSSSWRTCQHSLLEESGESCTTWPKQGMWDRGAAYELPTSEPLTVVSASSSSRDLPTPTSRDWKGQNQRNDDTCLPGAVMLLPTPMAYETDPSDELVEEIRANIDPNDPHHRLYLEGRKWFSQRTLSRIAPALLPTPSANDSTGAEKETREARQEDGTGGPSLRDLPKLLPTPVANPDNPGTGGELRAAIVHGEERRNETGIDTMGRPNLGRPSKLLPTPMGNQGRAAKEYIPGGDKMSDRSLPTVARAAGEGKLLPTPTTEPTSGNGHARNLGAEAKLLPTPTAQAAKHGVTEDLTANGHGFNLWDVPHQLPTGESTETPSGAGSSSPGLHPDQLTIGDA